MDKDAPRPGKNADHHTGQGARSDPENRAIIGDPHNRVVGGGLAIVSEASTLRETVELRAAHGVRASNETHSRVTTRTDVGLPR